MLLTAGADYRAGQVSPLMTAIREKNYKVMRVLHEFGVRSDDGAVDPS